MSEYKYFTSVEGHLTPRFSTLHLPTIQFIGATRSGNRIAWDAEKVVPIPVAEFNKFRREFTDAVNSGSLIEVDKTTYDAYLAKLKKADEAFEAAKQKDVAESAKDEPEKAKPSKK
jgi:hypothetical protein